MGNKLNLFPISKPDLTVSPKMRWLQVHVDVVTAQVEAAETLLTELGAASIVLDDAADQPLLEPLPGEMPLWDQVIVTGLFSHYDSPEEGTEPNPDPDHIVATLRGHFPAQSITFDYLEEQVWERAWMDHYEPIQCGDSLWIVPEWLEPPVATAVNLKLDPGLAFGTGNHASTFLCLQWLDQLPLAGKTVVDYGCGSGILGIAALLLGAEKVYAVDLDPQAILATRQNAETNGVQDRLWVGLPEQFNEQLPELKANVIVANILAGPLMQLAPHFADHCLADGDIVLAGLISEQVEEVREAYVPWFNLNQHAIREENWCRLSGKRL